MTKKYGHHPKSESYTDTFNTPDSLFNQLNRVFNFQIDAACTTKNRKLPKGFFVDEGGNGLKEPWKGRVFCNPPFSQKKEWIEKAIKEVESGVCPVCVMILPLNCMSTTFFMDLVYKNYHYEIIKKRIEFLDDKTKKPASGNNSGTVVVYFKKQLANK